MKIIDNIKCFFGFHSLYLDSREITHIEGDGWVLYGIKVFRGTYVTIANMMKSKYMNMKSHNMIMTIIRKFFLTPRQKYVKAMLIAIAKSQDNGGYWGTTGSSTDALRAFKAFEEINGIKFDPFDEQHLRKTNGKAHFPGFHRAITRITNKTLKEYNER